jgi:hypothetical protein
MNAVLAGGVRTGEQEPGLVPPAEAHPHWVPCITGRSVVRIGQQLPVMVCVQCVNAVLAGRVSAGEERRIVPPASLHDDWVHYITGRSVVRIGPQLPVVVVHRVYAVLA